MLSYRHGFHAGNHADVLKHAVLVHVLDYLGRKDKPFWYVDTHAGAPGYDLADTEQAFYRWLWIDKKIGGNLHTIVHAVSRRVVLQGLWYFVDKCQVCGARTS